MAKFLADENVHGRAVRLLREKGFDVASMGERSPGADDEAVLKLAVDEGRVLLTFDKDFGELAFKRGKAATCGIVLFRTKVRGREAKAAFMLSVLTQPTTWEGNFSVASDGQLRVVPLPQTR
jgi:predicted nuclease of predicted toxin-antitoxin system